MRDRSTATTTFAAGLATAALAACAPLAPAPGSDAGAVRASWGEPTARYALDDGGTRLEYASGPFGRTTWMIDVDRAGRVVTSRQVLNEAEFARLQADGAMPRAELLRRLGTPGERKALGWVGGEGWSWRYPTNDCLWFQVTLDRAGVVNGSGYGIDPACDRPSNDRTS